MQQCKDVRLRIDVYRERPVFSQLRVGSSPIGLSVPDGVFALAYGVLTETLSKVAVAAAEALPLFTAKPKNTFGAMLIV